MARKNQKALRSNKKSVIKKSKAKAKSSSRLRSKTAADLIHLGGEIWPMERNILFRPDRLKYVRKLVEDKGCVFCNAHKLGVKFESLCVYQSKHSLVVLNKYPYNSGHLLIIPKKHCSDFSEINEEIYIDLQLTIKKSVEVIQKAYQPGGINIGVNMGAVAGAGIPDHLHYHVIPRWSGDLNFFPLIAETKTVIESLEQTYERLFPLFKSE